MDMDLPVVYGKYLGAITSVVFFLDFIPWRLFEAETLFLETHWVKPVQMSQ